MVSLKRVVVIGGGFGGLWAVRALKSAPVDITLIDRCNHHLFQPLLYQVATAGLAAPSIAAPLRHILRQQANVTVLLGDVYGIDPVTRRVLVAERTLDYDYLIVASGAMHAYFGHDDWAPLSNIFEDRSGADAQAAAVRQYVHSLPPGELVVLVSHGVTINHIVGGAGLAVGESVVVRAGAGPAAPLQVIGRLVVP